VFEANAEFERSSFAFSVSYGMEPEQEALSIVSFKDREAASPVNK